MQIDLPNQRDCENQDGLHFWGPGRFLTLQNIHGRSGDDFIALAPDEHDRVSSITDVLIDGVMLDHADQGIRPLSREKGRLDRVTIRNVTGTYRSFGFYINPWFPGPCGGNFGDIRIENVDLRPGGARITHRPAFSLPDRRLDRASDAVPSPRPPSRPSARTGRSKPLLL